MDNPQLEWTQRELAKRLGLKKHPMYPAEPLRLLLSDPERREDLNRAWGREEEWEAFLPFARLAYQVWENAGPREPLAQDSYVSERTAEQLGHDATKRAAVFSEYLASRGTPAFSGPKGFRGTYLDDKLLPPQQARELLTSPAAAYWSAMEFKLRKIPVVGHACRTTKDMNDEKGDYSLVEVRSPSSGVVTVEDRRPLPAVRWEIPTRPEDARSHAKPKRELEAPTGHWKILPFPGEDGHTHRGLVWTGSVLGELHDEVGRLIQHYPWEEQDAVWFVLTGETPQVAPLTWQARWSKHGVDEDAFGYGFVTLKIEPWVDPKLVWKVYSDIQRGLRGERRNRRLDPKTLDLLRFVNERVMVADLSRSERRRLAPELVAAWDRENPDKSYNGNTREFWKAYHRARRAVISPTYEWRGEN